MIERVIEMTYIILDLEWNMVRKKGQRPEITEIGAIKVEKIDGKLVKGESFQSHVKPVFREVSKDTKKFTGVKLPDIQNAPHFPEVLDNFLKWSGEEAVFCTWGIMDIIVFYYNCEYHYLSSDWLIEYIDVQQEFSSLYQRNKSNLISLKEGIKLLSLDFSGNQHNALDDAVNTAEIFMKTYYTISLNIKSAQAIKLKEQKKMMSDSKYKTKVKSIYYRRLRLNIGRKELSDISGMNLIDIARIECFKRYANDLELKKLNNTINTVV